MEVLDAIKDAWDELLHHKLRTVLTLLGMIFGVGAVIAMLSIGEGAEQQALKLIDSMGMRNLLVNARVTDSKQLKEIREHSAGLSLDDMRIVAETFDFIETASAQKKIRSFVLVHGTSRHDFPVMGVTPNHFELIGFSAQKGRLFNRADDQRFSQVAVIGAEVAHQMFADSNPIGELIKVNHVWLKIVGVLESKSLDKDEFEGVKLGEENQRIFIPLNTAIERFRFDELEDQLDSIKLKIKSGVRPDAAADIIRAFFKIRHGDAQDFDIVVPARLMQQHRQTQRIFTIVMSCVAGISLLVGGIGIMNIMLATVLERTKEIGLLRAVGARKIDIMKLFIVESFTVSALGGFLGILLGYVIAEIIAGYAGWEIAFSLFAILLSVGVCGVIGVGFGLYPALTASKLDPIEALNRD